MKITQAHKNSQGTYGSPWITSELRDQGEVVSAKTVAKVMAWIGIEGISPRTFKVRTTVVDPAASFPPDLVDRQFDQVRLNAVWLSKVITAAWLRISSRLRACPGDRVPAVQGDLEVALAASVLLRGEAAKDAELLVLRHENTVLRRQLAGPVRYEPADRFWFAALSRLIHRSRWREAFPIMPGTVLDWHRRFISCCVTVTASTARRSTPPSRPRNYV